MGLKGLWNYENHQHLRIPHRLRDTKLVIDGNIFSKYLFEYIMSKDFMKSKYFYGGDYPDYSAQVRFFFSQLANCNVEPIVIFDGCSRMDMEPSARLAHHLGKYESRLRNAVKLCENGGKQVVQVDCEQNQPHWSSISNVLLQLLRDLSIVHRQCVTREADDIIPVIARYYQCPVLTNDSDFLLWDLPAGVIPMLDFFRNYSLDSTTFNNKYIECSIYYRESCLLAHLESKYGFKRELLPLVAPLLGYDRVNEIATRFIGHATQDQVNKLKANLKAQIGAVFERFASHFTSLKQFAVKQFGKLEMAEIIDQSFKHISSTSECELQKVLQRSLIKKLDEIASKSPIEIDMNKSKEIGQEFEDDLKQFYKTVQEVGCSNRGIYDRSLALFRWISSQSTLDKAIEKLAQFSIELKIKNLEFIQKNARFKHNSLQREKKTFKTEEFDHFLAQVKKQIVVPHIYEDLETKMPNLEPDLEIEQFLNKMHQLFFPQAPGIPPKFHRDLVHGRTSPLLLNILYNKLVLISIPIENYATLTNSSYACRFDLDAFIYGIILNHEDDAQVTRIYREGIERVIVEVQPKFEINGRRLPNLEQICTMAEGDRREWLFTIMQQACFNCEVNIDELSDRIGKALPEQSVQDAFLLMILALIMCTHKCPTELTSSLKWNPFRSAMLVNIFAMGYIGHLDSKVPTFFNLDQDRIDLFQTKFPDPIPSSTFDLSITHYFNCYHNCLQSLDLLIQLLNLFESFQLDRFVCGLQGIFVHTMTEEFLNQDSFESFLEAMNLPEAINELLVDILKI